MSLLSAILPRDDEGVKWAKLQRLFRQMADNAGISYALGFPLTDIHPSDTEGIKWQKLGAWAKLIADNIGGGGVPAGPITTSGLTMNTARILGRTTAGSGAVEEMTVDAGLLLSAGSLSVAPAQTTITSITSPGALTLEATGQNINLVSNRVVSDNTIEILGTWGVDAASGNAVHYVTALIGWSPAGNPTPTDALDTAFYRNAAGVAELNNGTPGTFRDLKLRNLIPSDYIEGTEMTAPAAPAANSYRLYAADVGGKTAIFAKFNTGAAQQIAIEP